MLSKHQVVVIDIFVMYTTKNLLIDERFLYTILAKRDAAQLNSARLMANNVVRLKHKEMPKNFEVISDVRF